MERGPVGTSLYAGFLLAVLGLFAWASGQPAIFPSLGPSAFVLAVEHERRRTDPTRVVGGHLLGAVAGLLSYLFVAGGVTLTPPPPAFSPAGLRLAASGTLSVGLTAGGMVATDAVHPPACATTLIVSLGLLSTPRQVAVVVASVVALVAVHVLVLSLGDVFDGAVPEPSW